MSVLFRTGAIFVVALKRLFAERRLALLTVAGLTVAVAITLSVPLYADAVYGRTLSGALLAKTPADEARPPFAFMFRHLASGTGPAKWDNIQAADSYLSRQAAARVGIAAEAKRALSHDGVPGAVSQPDGKRVPDHPQPVGPDQHRHRQRPRGPHHAHGGAFPRGSPQPGWQPDRGPGSQRSGDQVGTPARRDLSSVRQQHGAGQHARADSRACGRRVASQRRAGRVLVLQTVGLDRRVLRAREHVHRPDHPADEKPHLDCPLVSGAGRLCGQAR